MRLIDMAAAILASGACDSRVMEHGTLVALGLGSFKGDVAKNGYLVLVNVCWRVWPLDKRGKCYIYSTRLQVPSIESRKLNYIGSNQCIH